jgi:hypothetical protein
MSRILKTLKRTKQKPRLKMSKIFYQTFHERKYTCGQLVHGKYSNLLVIQEMQIKSLSLFKDG